MKKLSLFGLPFLCAPLLAQAAPVEVYLQQIGHVCGDRSYVVEWAVVGDTDATVTLTRFLRREDRSKFDEQSWEVEGPALDGAYVLNDERGKPHTEVRGFLSENPVAVRLDRRGEARDDCVQTLVQRPAPAERYQTALDLLNTPEPVPQDAARATGTVATLPPKEMLPALSQAATTEALEEAREGFWERYAEAAVVPPADPNDPAHLTALEAVWVAQTERKAQRYHLRILQSAQRAQMAQLAAAGGDVTDLRPRGAERLCPRLEAARRVTPWEDYLEAATGLPLQYWTDEEAEAILSETQSCERGEALAKVITDRWESIEARGAGYAALEDERARLSNLEVTFDVAAAENWFTVSRGFLDSMRENGIERDEVLAALSSVLADRQADMLALLPDAIEAAFEAADLEPQQYRGFCSSFTSDQKFPRRSEIEAAAKTACEDFVASRYASAATDVLETERDRLAALTPTLEVAASENWFELDRGFISRMYQLGIDRDRVAAVLTPVLEGHKTSVAETLVAEIDAALEGDMDLGDYESFCRKFINGQSLSRSLQDIARQHCIPQATQLFEAKAVEAITAARDDMLGRDGTMQDMMETRGYDLRAILPRAGRLQSDAFQSAMKRVDEARSEAQRDVEGAYQTALANTLEEIKTTFENAEPLTDSETAAMRLCDGYQRGLSNDRLAPVARQCETSVGSLTRRRAVAECDLVWEMFDVPDEIQTAMLDMPERLGGQARRPLRNVICQADKTGIDLYLEKAGGWFSSSYRLARRANIDGSPVEYSVTLKQQSVTATLEAVEPEMKPSVFASGRFVVPDEPLLCLYVLDVCITR